MKSVGVAILGLGVVGSGTYKILRDHREFYKETQDVDISVESVLEINKQKALALGIEESRISDNIAEVVSNPNVDIVVEVIGGVEPARTFVLAALHSGKSVVTSNKELFCKYWHELERAAKRTNAGLYFEASCVGGVPIIRTLIDGMQANHIRTLKGIINGTTNYILTRMAKEGLGYQEVLKDAQALGYAEANPAADVEGYDAAYKLSILSSLAFHKKVPLDKIYREGITSVDRKDIKYGAELGYTLKLLAIGKNGEEGIEARVHPAFVKNKHPLASVNGSFNAVYLQGDSVGDIMLYGRGAGDMPTGSAIVSDVIYAATHSDVKYSTFKNSAGAEKGVRFVNDFRSRYYIRFTARDKAGVLAKVAGIFAKFNISIVDLIQKGEEQDNVPIILVTHETGEMSLRRAVEKIRALEDVVEVNSVIRVED
ncbi:homoserine dehydrogenase [Candidatus Borkfalkia ceftriaxoniphila]|uniref:Homoserine dehydrogenase n=1 Tax=Candidatus Borkfalkia ceftriaxoniphila TaxID=2508949 RepID=A0A4Q2K511_9FIRM|nr:homoserine dehydrogenase [Candidatus Borkfalkia ceftriaxoniphila]RXZ58042.1 homoserine dehydrogenase [Candidatus Borkfalkia ceftriaxoniphila]